MARELLIYRPTKRAIEANDRAARPPLPREIHVHAEGPAFAYYEGAPVRFPTIHDLLEHHRLVPADLEELP